MDNSPRFPKCYKVDSKPHKFCPGCGHPIVLKMLGEVIDELGIADKTVFMVDIGCSLLAWDYFDLPTTQTHHGRTVPTAVGFKIASPEKIVIAYIGDGGAYAIGLQHTISACLRNSPVTTVVVNNTLYGMTGGQLAPTTIDNEITTTTPNGKSEFNTIKGPELLRTITNPQAYFESSRNKVLPKAGPYIARGTTDKPLVLKQYLKKAIETQINGHYSFIETLSACPTNWKTNAEETISRLCDLEKTFKTGELK